MLRNSLKFASKFLRSYSKITLAAIYNKLPQKYQILIRKQPASVQKQLEMQNSLNSFWLLHNLCKRASLRISMNLNTVNRLSQILPIAVLPILTFRKPKIEPRKNDMKRTQKKLGPLRHKIVVKVSYWKEKKSRGPHTKYLRAQL